MATITFRGTREELYAILYSIPAILTGRAPDPLGLAKGMQLRLGTALLSKIQQAFLQKALGQTGSDGIKWPPLSPVTIAQRTRTRTEESAYKEMRKIAVAVGVVYTKQDYFGGRAVEILRDTGKLLRSLTTGIDELTPSDNPDQIFRLGVGQLIVGTNVPYAEFHQHGTSRMPARKLWPDDGIPDAWWPAILLAGLRGMLAITEAAIRNFRR